MVQRWRVGVVVLMMAAICCASHGRVRTEFTIEVLEVTDYPQDPLAIEEAGILEKQARLLQSRVAALRRDPPREPSKQRAHLEKIRDLEKERGVLLRSKRLADQRVSAGMCEIYGWDGVAQRAVIIECRGNQRSPARRLSAGMIVRCIAESVRMTPQGLELADSVLTAVGTTAVQALPPIWNFVPDALPRSVRFVQAQKMDEFAGGIRQEVGKDGEASLVAYVHDVPRLAGPSIVRQAVVHVHMLDQEGRRASQLTKGAGLIVRAARYRMRVARTLDAWITAAANHGGAVPIPHPAVRLTPPPRAPRGGYEVEILEAWVRP